jgi:predicted small lipoprotein YifL
MAGKAGVRRVCLLALAALPLLAACGRSGPPRPPGPAEAITFPRQYPAPEPVQPGIAPR